MRTFSFLILFLCRSLLAYPEVDARGNYSENFLGLQGKVSIKLNSMNYKPDDDIWVDITVKNYGNEVIRFYPTTENLRTYQFVITDENDEVLPPRETLRLEELKSAKIKHFNLSGDKVKEIIIHKGESFTKRLNLTDYYEFQLGKKYFVTSYFYPNYLEDRDSFAKSENQSIFMVEKKKEERAFKRIQENDVVKDGLSPEEVIFLFLGAELKKNWGNYFKYIYFPEYILAYNKFSSEYVAADPSTKDIVVDEFKRYLSENRSGKLTYYKVLSTEMPGAGIARVNVHVERELKRLPSKFEYQYTLKKTDETMKGFWKITGVVVRVKK